jgi:hypothetical protein
MKSSKGKGKESEESLGRAVRPVAKALVKVGVIAYDKLKDTVVQANTELTSLVEEARAEMADVSQKEKSGPETAKRPTDGKKTVEGGRKRRRSQH